MIEKELENLGLSNSESKIYIALLKFGKSSVSTLSDKTGVHRTYIYDLLDKLKEKSLVSQIKESGNNFFVANKPTNLKIYMEDTFKNLNNIIAELENISNSSNNSQTIISTYKGENGIKIVAEELIEGTKELCSIGVGEKFKEIIPYFMKKIVREMNERNIKERIILPKGENVFKSKNTNIRYLRDSNIPLTSMIISDSKVAIFLWSGELIQILIQSKDIAIDKKNEFEILWSNSEKE